MSLEAINRKLDEAIARQRQQAEEPREEEPEDSEELSCFLRPQAD